MTDSGTGIIFMAVVILDFLNGWLCFRLFELLGYRANISFDGTALTQSFEWITWIILYTSWTLKFFLCTYQLHRFLKGNLRVTWYPARPNLSRGSSPLSRKKGYIIVAVSMLWSLTQMTIMYLLTIYKVQHVSVPFLGIQTMLLFAGSWLVAALYFFTRYDPSASRLEIFVTSTIGLNCVFTLLADCFLTYGDMSCLFGYSTPNYMKPMCYCILARFLSYSDSIFFSAVQFRSQAVRGYFLDAIGLRKLIPGTKHLEQIAGAGHLSSQEEKRALLEGVSENTMSSYIANRNARDRQSFRRATLNDE